MLPINNPLSSSSSMPARALSVQETQLSSIASQSGFVHFYNHTNPLTEFMGNFYEVPITYQGHTFRCSEAAFQAAKFPHRMHEFTNLNGDQAFKHARTLDSEKRTDWLDVNYQVMRDVIFEKFDQHPHLAKLLLATEGAYLVEHIPVVGRDKYWGDNCDGTGQNKLGQLLMELRGGWLGGKAGIVPAPHAYNNFIRGSVPARTQALSPCILPGCNRQKYVDPSGKEHPFCGRSHATEFTTKHGQVACKKPGCNNPRFVETTGRVHDFCCRSHSK